MGDVEHWSTCCRTALTGRVLAGQDHLADPAVLVPLAVDFLTS